MKSQLMKSKIALILILLSAYFIRVFGVNWDQGFHLHPDERMLIMVADKISFFKNLNPDFFNYGSLPIYLLKGLSQLLDLIFRSDLATYAGMLTTGRRLSIIFDMATMFLIYKITKIFFKENKVALFSVLFYSISFFPIQNSHFFVVDVLLNTLITGLIYILLIYFKLPSLKKVLFIGLTFAAMMATKFTAIIFLPIILSVIVLKTVKQWKNVVISLAIFTITFFMFHFFFMPYAYIEHTRFILDIKAQLKMNSDPYILPYTLQYVGSLPYLYYLKNIFMWGLGPIMSILSIIGLYQISKIKYQNYIENIKKKKYLIFNMSFLFFIFYFLYFLVIGQSAVKFMRYMLPLYPLFAILAGYGFYQIYKLSKTYSYLVILLCLVWSFMFINIYTFPHTRISASDWILKNIPKGSTLAVEHWDDRLPILGSENYFFEELTIYEQPDDKIKWQILNEKLKKTDYIIIASNRLYIPLSKLSDCKKYRSCYPETAKYYQKLFGDKLSFKKIVEFSNYPRIEMGNYLKLEINDDSADESFTVYDHPKIIIFKRFN